MHSKQMDAMTLAISILAVSIYFSFPIFLSFRDTEVHLKEKFNNILDQGLLDNRRAFLLKTIINNYQMIQRGTNFINSKTDIFKLSDSKLEQIVENAPIIHSSIFILYSLKMICCTVGPLLIPVFSHIIQIFK